MNDMVKIRSAQQYFEEYGREALYKQKADKKLVKQQLIDAFHKEIFGLVAMRAKKKFDDIPVEGDPEALKIAANVIKDTTRKWKKLCDMLNTYRETSGCIQYSDLTLIPEEGNGEIGWKDGELVTRDILNEEEVLSEGDADGDEFVTMSATHGDCSGFVEAAKVTDGPFTSGYVAVQEDIPAEDETHAQPSLRSDLT